VISLPDAPGTYALLLELHSEAQIRVGRFGSHVFPAGRYVYVGSAMGSRGLAARLARHIREEKRRFWHIDYLIGAMKIVGICVDTSGLRQECLWAQRLATTADCRMIVRGFGASDCSCATHLFLVGSKGYVAWRQLGLRLPGFAIADTDSSN